jgi:GNAT superfamily N-acetyltransferase
MIELSARSDVDEITDEVCRRFDFTFDGQVKTQVYDLPRIDHTANIGLIVGPSGSGKTTLLKQFNVVDKPTWDTNKSVCSHFTTADEAQERLCAVGLNSIPSWLKPFHALSNGEQFRAALARLIDNDTAFDEFTSVIDRDVAKSTCHSVQRFIRKNQIKNVVFASCHYDIIDWLQPDWVFDTATGELSPRGCLRRPDIELDVLPCFHEAWQAFSKHHYLTENINKSARCWVCFWGSKTVGFASSISYPSGTVKNAFREHRTVVLPDFQGLGIGVRLSDAVAQMHIDEGKRYFSKTVHPRMGEYRNASPLWKPTSKNMITRKDGNTPARWQLRKGLSFSHEYVGRDLQ